MNSNQLEQVCTKQEKYIKHLRLQYQKQWDLINPLLLKYEEYKEQANISQPLIQEITMAATNHQNQQNDYIVERQEEQNLKAQEIKIESVNLLDPEVKLDYNEYMKLREEVERLQRQCAQVCEEMRRLQEDNDDLNVAYDAEKQHKDRLMVTKRIEIEELTNAISKLEERQSYLLLELEAFQFQVDAKDKEIQKIKSQLQLMEYQNLNQLMTEESEQLKQNLLQEDQVLMKNKMENKINQDSLKVDNLNKDIERLMLEQTDRKFELERLFADKMKLEQVIIHLRQKRQGDKETLHKQELLYQTAKIEIEQLKITHQQQIQNLNLILHQTKEDKVHKQESPVEGNLTLFQRDNEIKDLKLAIILNEKHSKDLEEQIQDRDARLLAMEQVVQVLQKKREFAISEISNLTDTVHKLQRKGNDSTPKQLMPPRNGNKKVQVFQTLKKVGKDIRKLIEELYKEFVNILITLKETLDSDGQATLLSIEKKINDCNRRTQDFLDLFDDLGV